MPFNLLAELQPKFCKAKIILLHEDESNRLPSNQDENAQFLNVF